MASTSYPAACPIPIDYTVSKPYLNLSGDDLSFYDYSGNLVFRVVSKSNNTPPQTKTLLDAFGTPLFTAIQQQKGYWQGFHGNSWDFHDLIFTVKRTSSSPLTDLEVFLAREEFGQPKCSFRLKGNPFHRACTIYKGDTIVAKTTLNYKLGKVFPSRRKFRLTIYPGIDHVLVVALHVIFFW